MKNQALAGCSRAAAPRRAKRGPILSEGRLLHRAIGVTP